MLRQIIRWLSRSREQALQLLLHNNGGLKKKLVHVDYGVNKNPGDFSCLGEPGLQGGEVILVSLLILSFSAHVAFNHLDSL